MNVWLAWMFSITKSLVKDDVALDIAVRALDFALGNHALRAQPTDYSLNCRYRLVNNL